MALIPKNDFPGQTIITDPNYPHGKARNVTAPGDGNGTPWEERVVNDLWGFMQALLARGGVAPSGVPDNVAASDYVDSLNSAYHQTLQEAYDKSVLDGDNPTIALGSDDLRIVASNGAETEFGNGQGSLLCAPSSTGGNVLVALDGGAIEFFEPDAEGIESFRVRAGSMVQRHDITVPPAPNTASKGALVRAPGSGEQATEWMPMDWGDTYGGGAGWVPAVSDITGPISNIIVSFGSFHRIGNIVSVSAKGSAESSGIGTATFEISLPIPSNFVDGNEGAFAASSFSPSVKRIAAATDAVTPEDAIQVNMELDGAGNCAWALSGQYVIV